MTCFRWLHLTDLHWGSDDHKDLWGSIKKPWLDDIDRVQTQCGGPWDAVFFTGDLVNRGEKKEFDQLTAKLTALANHLKSARSVEPSEPFFIAVPGNHDLKRPGSENHMCMIMTELWDKKENIRNDIWRKKTGSKAWKFIHRAFKNYTAWYHDPALPFKKPPDMTHGLLPGEFCATLSKDKSDIGILGLNTAFLQLDNGDFQGKLDAHAAQVTSTCGEDYHKWAENHDACLLLTHHPADWFSLSGQDAFNAVIAPPGRFALHLCGHNHEPELIETKLGGDAHGKRVLCGKSLFGMMKITDWKGETQIDRSHGYSAGRIDFSGEAPKLRIWPRRMDKKTGGVWDFNQDVSFHLEMDQGTKPVRLTSTRKPRPALVKIEPEASNIILETPPPAAAEPGVPKTGIKELVKKKIGEMLDKKKSLKCFRSVLHEMFEVDRKRGGTASLIVDRLLAMDLNDAIMELQVAVRDCLNTLKDDGCDMAELTLTWNDCVSILGWMVLVGVKEEWAVKAALALANRDSALDLTVPVKTEVGLDIAVSRLKEVKATFKLDTSMNLSALGRIDLEKWQIETGWNLDEKVLAVKKQLWKQLNRLDASAAVTVSDEELTADLKQVLRSRRRMGENHYMVVNLPGKECTYMDVEVYRRLVTDLQNLDIFYLGDSDTGMAIVAETELHTQIREFLRYKPTEKDG